MMKKKAYILILLFFVFNTIIAQTNKIKTISIEGETYFVYPEFQDEKYGNDLSWKINNIVNKYNLDTNTNIDGKWIQFYKNDTTKIAKKFILKNKKLNGKYVEYFPNGIKEEEIEYKDEKVFGFWIRWYKNGQVMDSAKYRLDTSIVNGYISSSKIYCKRWYENGNIELIENYDSLGQKNGKWTYFYANGNIKKEISYTNEGSNVENSIIYKKGLKNGVFVIYYKNGQERIKINYSMGYVIDGYYCEYYPNGKQKRCGILKNGLLDGKWTEWYDNGNIKSEGKYKNGK